MAKENTVAFNLISATAMNLNRNILPPVGREWGGDGRAERRLTLYVQRVLDAKLGLQGRVAHHAGEPLALGVALRLPQVAHVRGAGAVGLLVALLLAAAVQLRIPEDLGGGAASLGDAGGHQRLIGAVQQGGGARGHVDLRLH